MQPVHAVLLVRAKFADEFSGLRLWRDPLKAAETIPACQQVWRNLDGRIIRKQRINQRQMDVVYPEPLLGLRRQFPQMPVFLKPLLRDLPRRSIGQLDEQLAPLERFAYVMQLTLLA